MTTLCAHCHTPLAQHPDGTYFHRDGAPRCVPEPGPSYTELRAIIAEAWRMLALHGIEQGTYTDDVLPRAVALLGARERLAQRTLDDVSRLVGKDDAGRHRELLRCSEERRAEWIRAEGRALRERDDAGLSSVPALFDRIWTRG